MISVSEAKRMLCSRLERGPIITLSLLDALGHVLSESVFSPIDVPSFDNSAMDGYAMKFEEGSGEWRLQGKIQAGDIAAEQVKPGSAVRIFTGAKMPKDADTVIPQELIDVDENRIQYKADKIKPGANVRLRGSQCKKGEKILLEGSRINAGRIGLLASVGVGAVKVYTSPKVHIIVTGNELREVGQELKAGEIYNSNGPMLEACLRQDGVLNQVTLAVPDDKQSLQEAIDKTLNEAEILILSGGISVGDYDFVKECLEQAGVEELFYKVKQRPGKPFYAGKRDNQWIFALPGNPASVLSCYHHYVRPCINYWKGMDAVFEPDELLPLNQQVRKKKGFTFFMKGKVKDGKVEVLGGQQSFNMISFGDANCLVSFNEDTEAVEAGTLVEVYYL